MGKDREIVVDEKKRRIKVNRQALSLDSRRRQSATRAFARTRRVKVNPEARGRPITDSMAFLTKEKRVREGRGTSQAYLGLGLLGGELSGYPFSRG